MKVVKEVILNLTKRNGRLNESQFTVRSRVPSRLVLSNVDFIPHLKEGQRLRVKRLWRSFPEANLDSCFLEIMKDVEFLLSWPLNFDMTSQTF